MNQNSKMNKKEISLKIMLVILILLIILLSVLFIIFKKDKEKTLNSNEDELVLSDKLWQEYKNENLTTDEYVKYLLYSEYDIDLLDEKYKSLEKSDLVNTDKLINNYYDELSEETLNYYLNKINLEDITFELNVENDDTSENGLALADLFVDTVYAASNKVTNLNKVVLSENGNFVVWYTTTGDSATDYKSAKKIADGLEESISEYKELFGYDYNFSSNVISKGKKYKNQISVLKNSGIDSSYLENAMQVYLVNYTDSSLAKYVGRSAALRKMVDSLKGGDEYDSIISPYILIKPSSFNDYERLEQLYNHELFHHYQYEILCGHSECEVGKDPYIIEATANWASSLVTSKTKNYGFLNEWAGTAKAFANNLMSDEFKNKYGINNVGYALFVYLNSYSNNVYNGTKYIIDSIYQDDSLKYLYSKTDVLGLKEIQKNIAIKNLSQDYINKNLNVDLDFNAKLPIESIISSSDEMNNISNQFSNVNISALGINYYMVPNDLNYAFEINFTRDNYYIALFIIALKDGKYTIVDQSSDTEKIQTFNTNAYGEYSDLYVAIANTLSDSRNYYDLDFKNIEKQKENQDKNNDYFSILGCGYSDGVEKGIETYYFDEDGISRYILTINWLDESEAIDNYESELANSNKKNVKIKGKTVTSEYTEDAIKKYWSNKTREDIISSYEYECGVNIIDFKPDIN